MLASSTPSKTMAQSGSRHASKLTRSAAAESTFSNLQVCHLQEQVEDRLGFKLEPAQDSEA